MSLHTIRGGGSFSAQNIREINENFDTLLGTQVGGTLADGDILVGNGDDEATAVTPSGDVSLTNAGVFTVTGLNGEALTADGAEVDAAVALIAAIPTENVASPAIWNDNGVLKVGTA